MLKNLVVIVSGAVFLMFLSPLFLYWWALSNVDQPPQPSKLVLTPEQEWAIWKKELEVGIPRVKPITIYGYINFFNCNLGKPEHSHECINKYPGLRISSLAIRNQVADQFSGESNMVWHFTWVAYSIWVTRNWDIHEILATYYEAYSV